MKEIRKMLETAYRFELAMEPEQAEGLRAEAYRQLNQLAGGDKELFEALVKELSRYEDVIDFVYARTNGYDMILAINVITHETHYLIENEYFPCDAEIETFMKGVIEEAEISGWEMTYIPCDKTKWLYENDIEELYSSKEGV